MRDFPPDCFNRQFSFWGESPNFLLNNTLCLKVGKEGFSSFTSVCFGRFFSFDRVSSELFRVRVGETTNTGELWQPTPKEMDIICSMLSTKPVLVCWKKIQGNLLVSNLGSRVTCAKARCMCQRMDWRNAAWVEWTDFFGKESLARWWFQNPNPTLRFS